MTTAVITLNAGTGGERPIIDTLTTVDGLPAPAGSSVQIVKQAFGVANNATTVTTANPLPVTFPAGKNYVTVADTQSDIHGQLVGVTRITQITTKFFQQAPSAFLNVSVSGGATATGPTAGAGVFSTSTATTAALLAQTPVGILYAAQYEAWAVLSGAYTNPTSAASFQRLGIYDAANGYAFGYSGLTFGLLIRVNGVDTFIAQTAWNRDVLNGASTSQFTSNNAPVVFVPANMNMFRVRFGWYGAVSTFYEVYAPDGNWVVVHQVRTVNAQLGVNITMPDLPMTVEVSKTASDATNLSITCGGWAAGITAPNSGANMNGQRSLAALNAAVNIPLSGIGELSFSILGTWVGTLSFQYSLDGLTWYADAALTSAGTFATSTTANNAFTAAVGSYRFYRVLASLWTSGSASITYSGSSSSNFVVSQTLITDGNNNGPAAVKPAGTAAVAADPALVVAFSPNNIASVAGTRSNAGTGVAANSLHLTIGGSDGTNLRPLSVDLTGRLNTNTVLAAETTKVIGTVNIAAAQTIAALTAITNALPAGANVIGALVANQTVNKTQIAGVTIAAGVGVSTAGTQRTVLATDVPLPPLSEQRASTLWVTATGLVNTAVTASLPAPAAGLFHYITSIQVVKVYNALGVAAGAGVGISSINLPGAPAWTTEQAAGAVGTAVTVINYQPTTPLRSAAAATLSSIAAPAQLQTIWRMNVSYFTGP